LYLQKKNPTIFGPFKLKFGDMNLLIEIIVK